MKPGQIVNYTTRTGQVKQGLRRNTRLIETGVKIGRFASMKAGDRITFDGTRTGTLSSVRKRTGWVTVIPDQPKASELLYTPGQLQAIRALGIEELQTTTIRRMDRVKVLASKHAKTRQYVRKDDE